MQSLTEDVISILLHLIEGEQKKRGAAHSADALAIQVAACIVSLCGVRPQCLFVQWLDV